MRLYYFFLDWFQGKPLGGLRSPQWSSIRKQFLKEHPACAVCGKKSSLLKPLNIHHCLPFHIDKSLELSPQNLITLCPEHHLLVGHLMNFQSFNKNVREDSQFWLEKIIHRP